MQSAARASFTTCPSRATALIRRRFSKTVGAEESGFFAYTWAAGSDTLRHGNVVFVEGELAAVDPGAEAKVGGEDGKAAGDDASDDSGDVGSVTAVVAAGAADARGAGFGDGGAVGVRDGVGDWFSCSQGTSSGGLCGGGDGGATGGVAADNRLNGGGDLVAVGAGEGSGVVQLRKLFILGVGY